MAVAPKSDSVSSHLASGEEIDCVSGRKIWTVGTLRYTKGALVMLFFWLVWNDFFLMLMESVKPALTGLLMKDHGATNTEIALINTITTVFTIWINPVVSTWSDRTRTFWGRRRPFLLAAAPPAAFFLALIPWSPKIYAWLLTFPVVALLFPPGSINGAVVAITISAVLFGIFNSVLLAIFNYYFWDVVPVTMLGRFNAVARIVTTIKTFVWNYWIFGLAETHMEWIYGVIAALFLIVYVSSVIAVKEGKYPPPEPRDANRNWMSPIKNYVKECYGKPYYLWVFAGFALYQLGNVANMFRLFHWRDVLELPLDVIGKCQAWPSVAIVILGYPLGALIDRLGPMRMMAPSLFFWAAVNVWSFFFLQGAVSLTVYFSTFLLAQFVNGICTSVMMVEVFPREKIGQFCSANQFFHSTVTFVATPVIGLLFDRIDDYTYGYAFSAVFQIIAAFTFVKVFFNWKRRKASQAPSA